MEATMAPTIARPMLDHKVHPGFTLAIVGASGKSRTDYTRNSEDNVLASGVAASPNALGFFGFAYYASHRETLKAVPIDGGKGCVAPSADTVHDATYQPLSRPLFIYVKVESARRPEVRGLVRAYLDPATTQIVKRIGYMPLPLGTTLRVGQRFEDGTVGSVFGGRGAIVGITADVFRDDDKIKSALVR
jgi:phosphate transport system substrate-binding protein